MCKQPLPYIIVALTNIAYFLLALWLWRTHHPYGWILVAVGLMSTLFHLQPHSKLAFWGDIIVANVSILYLAYIYGTHAINSTYLQLSFFTFALAVFLFADSGDDRESSKYIWMHGTWHVLTALALYFIVKSTDIASSQASKL